jgi:hypothetical protein
MTQPRNEWQDLAQDWLQQPAPVVDIEALRREVERRGRELRRVVWVEIGGTVLALALCLFIAFAPGSDPAETRVFGGLAAALLVYQSVIIWLRRRDLASDGRDALSLIDLEIRRATTVLRYWRWGMWSALVMWLTLYVYFIASMALGWEGVRLSGLAMGLGLNVVLFPLMGLYGWWSCRRARSRLQRFRSLREQLSP